MSVYIVDIDGTITRGPGYNEYTDEEVMSQIPHFEMIDAVNVLYDKGHTIIFHTSRLWANFEITVKWLEIHGVKYHTLVMGKPLGHYHVDDKNMSIEDFLASVHAEYDQFTSPKVLVEKSVNDNDI